ncbi:uncharacterized protein LOC143179568 [Calliopsis andreniformis]|uniref:uncharacterized protein LOC143179568 n=1 Tax=Calliopsis andreniformis TaxID=337506 RepID=UPI003FCC33F7
MDPRNVFYISIVCLAIVVAVASESRAGQSEVVESSGQETTPRAAPVASNSGTNTTLSSSHEQVIGRGHPPLSQGERERVEPIQNKHQEVEEEEKEEKEEEEDYSGEEESGDEYEDKLKAEDEGDDEYEDELKAVAESHEAMSRDDTKNSNASTTAGSSVADGVATAAKNFDSQEVITANDSDEDVASNEAITDELDDKYDREVAELLKYKKQRNANLDGGSRTKTKRVPTVKKELSTQREILIGSNETQVPKSLVPSEDILNRLSEETEAVRRRNVESSGSKESESPTYSEKSSGEKEVTRENRYLESDPECLKKLDKRQETNVGYLENLKTSESRFERKIEAINESRDSQTRKGGKRETSIRSDPIKGKNNEEEIFILARVPRARPQRAVNPQSMASAVCLASCTTLILGDDESNRQRTFLIRKIFLRRIEIVFLSVHIKIQASLRSQYTRGKRNPVRYKRESCRGAIEGAKCGTMINAGCTFEPVNHRRKFSFIAKRQCPLSFLRPGTTLSVESRLLLRLMPLLSNFSKKMTRNDSASDRKEDSFLYLISFNDSRSPEQIPRRSSRRSTKRKISFILVSLLSLLRHKWRILLANSIFLTRLTAATGLAIATTIGSANEPRFCRRRLSVPSDGGWKWNSLCERFQEEEVKSSTFLRVSRLALLNDFRYSVRVVHVFRDFDFDSTFSKKIQYFFVLNTLPSSLHSVSLFLIYIEILLNTIKTMEYTIKIDRSIKIHKPIKAFMRNTFQRSTEDLLTHRQHFPNIIEGNFLLKHSFKAELLSRELSSLRFAHERLKSLAPLTEQIGRVLLSSRRCLTLRRSIIVPAAERAYRQGCLARTKSRSRSQLPRLLNQLRRGNERTRDSEGQRAKDTLRRETTTRRGSLLDEEQWRSARITERRGRSKLIFIREEDGRRSVSRRKERIPRIYDKEWWRKSSCSFLVLRNEGTDIVILRKGKEKLHCWKQMSFSLILLIRVQNGKNIHTSFRLRFKCEPSYCNIISRERHRVTSLTRMSNNDAFYTNIFLSKIGKHSSLLVPLRLKLICSQQRKGGAESHRGKRIVSPDERPSREKNLESGTRNEAVNLNSLDLRASPRDEEHRHEIAAKRFLAEITRDDIQKATLAPSTTRNVHSTIESTLSPNDSIPSFLVPLISTTFCPFASGRPRAHGFSENSQRKDAWDTRTEIAESSRPEVESFASLLPPWSSNFADAAQGMARVNRRDSMELARDGTHRFRFESERRATTTSLMIVVAGKIFNDAVYFARHLRAEGTRGKRGAATRKERKILVFEIARKCSLENSEAQWSDDFRDLSIAGSLDFKYNISKYFKLWRGEEEARRENVRKLLAKLLDQEDHMQRIQKLIVVVHKLISASEKLTVLESCSTRLGNPIKPHNRSIRRLESVLLPDEPQLQVYLVLFIVSPLSSFDSTFDYSQARKQYLIPFPSDLPVTIPLQFPHFARNKTLRVGELNSANLKWTFRCLFIELIGDLRHPCDVHRRAKRIKMGDNFSIPFGSFRARPCLNKLVRVDERVLVLIGPIAMQQFIRFCERERNGYILHHASLQTSVRKELAILSSKDLQERDRGYEPTPTLFSTTLKSTNSSRKSQKKFKKKRKKPRHRSSTTLSPVPVTPPLLTTTETPWQTTPVQWRLVAERLFGPPWQQDQQGQPEKAPLVEQHKSNGNSKSFGAERKPVLAENVDFGNQRIDRFGNVGSRQGHREFVNSYERPADSERMPEYDVAEAYHRLRYNQMSPPSREFLRRQEEDYQNDFNMQRDGFPHQDYEPGRDFALSRSWPDLSLKYSPFWEEERPLLPIASEKRPWRRGPNEGKYWPRGNYGPVDSNYWSSLANEEEREEEAEADKLWKHQRTQYPWDRDRSWPMEKSLKASPPWSQNERPLKLYDQQRLSVPGVWDKSKNRSELNKSSSKHEASKEKEGLPEITMKTWNSLTSDPATWPHKLPGAKPWPKDENGKSYNPNADLVKKLGLDKQNNGAWTKEEVEKSNVERKLKEEKQNRLFSGKESSKEEEFSQAKSNSDRSKPWSMLADSKTSKDWMKSENMQADDPSAWRRKYDSKNAWSNETTLPKIQSVGAWVMSADQSTWKPYPIKPIESSDGNASRRWSRPVGKSSTDAKWSSKGFWSEKANDSGMDQSSTGLWPEKTNVGDLWPSKSSKPDSWFSKTKPSNGWTSKLGNPDSWKNPWPAKGNSGSWTTRSNESWTSKTNDDSSKFNAESWPAKVKEEDSWKPGDTWPKKSSDQNGWSTKGELSTWQQKMNDEWSYGKASSTGTWPSKWKQFAYHRVTAMPISKPGTTADAAKAKNAFVAVSAVSSPKYTGNEWRKNEEEVRNENVRSSDDQERQGNQLQVGLERPIYAWKKDPDLRAGSMKGNSSDPLENELEALRQIDFWFYKENEAEKGLTTTNASAETSTAPANSTTTVHRRASIVLGNNGHLKTNRRTISMK